MIKIIWTRQQHWPSVQPSISIGIAYFELRAEPNHRTPNDMTFLWVHTTTATETHMGDAILRNTNKSMSFDCENIGLSNAIFTQYVGNKNGTPNLHLLYHNNKTYGKQIILYREIVNSNKIESLIIIYQSISRKNPIQSTLNILLSIKIKNKIEIK